MPFTFKRMTQRWDTCETVNINLKRKWVGQISTTDVKSIFKVRFMVIKNDINVDGNPNCKWRWMTLKTPQFQNIDEVKIWLNANYEEIIKLNLNNE